MLGAGTRWKSVFEGGIFVAKAGIANKFPREIGG
jgi:hypothetical protein